MTQFVDNLIAHALWDALRRGVSVRIMADIGMIELGNNLKKGVGDFDEIADIYDASKLVT